MTRRFQRIGLGACVLVLTVVAVARADSVFLKLGDITGEATAAGHEGEIDVLSWSWGASNPTTTGARSGLSAGRVAITELTVMKMFDRSSPKLFELVTKGTHAPAAVLIVRREKDGYEYLKITLNDVRVSALQFSAANERPTESVSLSFGKVVLEYYPNPTPGNPRPAAIPVSWDLAKAAP